MAIIAYAVNTKSKGKKMILLMCTVPNLAILGITRDDDKKKPAAFKVYDFTKGGTDIMDQRMDVYTTATKTRRWPRKGLDFVLDVTRVNSQSVYSLNIGKNPRTGLDSRKFGWAMAKSLILPYMIRRKAECYSLQKIIRKKMDLFLPEGREDGVDGTVDAEAGGVHLFPHDNMAESISRCAGCVKSLPSEGHRAAKNKLGKIRTQCSRCQAITCKEHYKLVCMPCTKDLQMKEGEVEIAEVD